MTKKPKGRSKNMQDDTVLKLIRGLNYLINQAKQDQLLNAARILTTAREEMVLWAVDFGCHESRKEKFINQQTLSSVGVDFDFFTKYLSTDDPKKRKNLLTDLEALRLEHMKFIKAVHN
jgi:hypothetical protein